MKRFLSILIAAWCLAAVAARGPRRSDKLAGRISNAAHKLNYTGSFTYQSGKNIETSRIAHLWTPTATNTNAWRRWMAAPGGRPQSRGAVLPARPEAADHRPVSARRVSRRLPQSPAALGENYRIRKGEVVRIAGMESQQIILEPKDDMRFGHHFWADIASGCCCCCAPASSATRARPSSSLRSPRSRSVRPSTRRRCGRVSPAESDWKVVNARGNEVKVEDTGWAFRHDSQGSGQGVGVAAVKWGHGEAYHVVFSGRLAAISVFIEPLAAQKSRAERHERPGPSIFSGGQSATG